MSDPFAAYENGMQRLLALNLKRAAEWDAATPANEDDAESEDNNTSTR